MDVIPGKPSHSLHSSRYFHSPSAVNVIYVSGNERKPVCGCPRLCLWAVAYGNTQKALRPRGPKAVPSIRNQLCHLFTNSAQSMVHLFLRLFPQKTNVPGERYSDAYATEMYASLTGMTMTSHSTCQYQLKGSGCWLF